MLFQMLPSAHCLQVLGKTAPAISTAVVDVMLDGNRAYPQLISQPMSEKVPGGFLRSASHGKLSISQRGNCACPFPAAALAPAQVSPQAFLFSAHQALFNFSATYSFMR